MLVAAILVLLIMLTFKELSLERDRKLGTQNLKASASESKETFKELSLERDRKTISHSLSFILLTIASFQRTLFRKR